MNLREKVFKAAKTVFAEKGYDAASVREIAEKAGVTKPVIYYYFKNKEGLYNEIISGITKELQTYLSSATSTARNLEERLHLYGKAFIEYFHQNKEDLTLFINELYRKKDHMVNLLDEILSSLKEGLVERFSPEESQNIALSYLGYLNLLILTEGSKKEIILHRLSEMVLLFHKFLT